MAIENFTEDELSALQSRHYKEALTPDDSVRNKVESVISIDPITKHVMERYGFNENSEFFRVMQPHFIVGKTDDGKYLIRGNQSSTTNVHDPYDENRKKRA